MSFQDFHCSQYSGCSPCEGPDTAFTLNFAVEKCYLITFESLKPSALSWSDRFKLSSTFSHQTPQIKFWLDMGYF